MEVSSAHSPKTELKDRVLWFDGDTVIPSNDILKFVLANKGENKLYVNELSAEIVEYNKLKPKNQKIGVKEQLNDIVQKWNIPQEYQHINVPEYVYEKLSDELEMFDDDEAKRRIQRVKHELKLYETLDLS